MYSRVHPYIPGVAIADQDPATIGAYHTSDVPYWFGTQDALNLIRPTRKWTAYDRRLSNQMMDTLFALANTGNRRHPACSGRSGSRRNERLVGVRRPGAGATDR